MNRTIIVLQGDQTGQELLVEALRVLEPFVRPMGVDFKTYDLSLENRRATKNQVVYDAAEAIVANKFGIKAATITPGNPDDVGSPNAILREAIDAQVILRVGRRIPPMQPVAGVHAPIAVVRMAVDGAYGAKEWREGEGLDEVAYRTEKIERKTCRIVAEYTFRYAERTGSKVFGGPKYTVSPVYEGMFKEEMDAAAQRHPSVRYDPQLIDATYALLLETTGESLVIPTLNRDGDSMSDLVLKMFGTIAGSESLVLGFNNDLEMVSVMAEAPHGTAPSLMGKNIANPMAMILAGASLVNYMDTEHAQRLSRAIRESALETVYDGIRTADLGGHATTTEFTDEVIRRVRAKLAVWEALG
ncbi:MAG TPA: isocitrate/isopropylmalate family dehydrogenase [Aggregatilinea sp.]|uniref:isocitrate/isopropylmalate family dehydrogenase n=1 Tax=Aggregatilinea sp. TaxID=2806333 RepID=UPI002D0D090B|nr:isocitrate/isopropylmalate family dehydrogenase [Aggregatilinea sp.]HML21061.1 isocitrate/isopropylmalate family dehydrogenase [Aggregatilinea sp.]